VSALGRVLSDQPRPNKVGASEEIVLGASIDRHAPQGRDGSRRGRHKLGTAHLEISKCIVVLCFCYTDPKYRYQAWASPL